MVLPVRIEGEKACNCAITFKFKQIWLKLKKNAGRNSPTSYKGLKIY